MFFSIFASAPSAPHVDSKYHSQCNNSPKHEIRKLKSVAAQNCAQRSLRSLHCLTPSSKHAEGGGGEEVAEQQGVGQQLLIAGLLSFLETAVQVAKEQITVSHPTGIEYTFFRRLSAPPSVDAPPTMLAKAHASCLSDLQNEETSATL